MRLARIEDDVVVNVIEVNPHAIPPEMADWPEAGEDVKIGSSYAEGVFTQPPAPDPAERLAQEREGMVVSRFQAKAALLQAGLLVEVENAVASGDALTQLAWAEAVEMRRNSPMIATLADAVDLTPEQVDDLFRAAKAIEA